MAHITIDARKYFDFGIGTYVRQLIENIKNMRTSHSYRLLVSPDDAPKVVPPPGWRMETVPYGKYSIGEFLFLGRRLKWPKGPAVFHAPHYTLPVGLRDRSVVTIHDIIHLKLPQYFSLAQRTYARAMIAHAVKDARFVLTVSECTRQDILRSFRVNEEKVLAVPLGVSGRFRRLSKRETDRFIASKDLMRPYLLFVGNAKPHKGIPTLLLALQQLAPSFQDLDLVIAGGYASQDPYVRSIIQESGLAGRVRELGRCSEDELVGAYNGAEVLVMPSLYEGFGLPVLEAMACGTCVVASDAGSLPEIAGDAAAIVRAGDPPALADVLRSVLRDSGLRRTLVQRGKKRATRFSWKETAKKTLEVYEMVAARGGRS